MMPAIFKSAGAHRITCKGNSMIIRCNSHNPTEFRLKRREMLLVSTSTSVQLPASGLMFNPNDQVSSLTNYHNLHAAQKLKFNYSSDIDVASLFRSSDQSCKGSVSTVGFSGMVSVPSQHYSLGNYDFVQARVSRPALRDCKEEMIILEGIKVKRDSPLWFDVYIRPAAGREEEDDDDDEYAGSFIHVPPRQKKRRRSQSHDGGQKQSSKISNCCLTLGISDILDSLTPDATAAHQETSVVVTMVPKFNSDPDPISVQSIRIQYS